MEPGMTLWSIRLVPYTVVQGHRRRRETTQGVSGLSDRLGVGPSLPGVSRVDPIHPHRPPRVRMDPGRDVLTGRNRGTDHPCRVYTGYVDTTVVSETGSDVVLFAAHGDVPLSGFVRR